MNHIDLVSAYRSLEDASSELQKALVEGCGADVMTATQQVTIARDRILTIGVADIEPAEWGLVQGIALKIKHINEINALLIRRRLNHIRQIRRDMSGSIRSNGYDARGQILPNGYMEIVDELA
jgi:hypothetical protein